MAQSEENKTVLLTDKVPFAPMILLLAVFGAIFLLTKD